MGQQIKSNNKINFKDVQIPLKFAFQTNIFNYVQKKKRQLSIFSALNQTSSHSKEKHSSTSSNLINQATALNFNQSNHNKTIDQQMLLTARIKLLDRKPSQKGSILKRKHKGHKSTLSDWRMLYDERQVIGQKHSIKQTLPEKMAVTDRLFYPRKKESHSVMGKGCKKLKQKQCNTKDETNPNKQQKFFVSHQNFFHMYHRSVTPIASDYAQKKRIFKYLNDNKQRRGSKNGLRLMNEGIFSNLSKNDVAFVPYKFQPQNSKQYSDLEQNLSSQIVKNPKFVLRKADSFSESKHSNHFGEIDQQNRTQIKKFISISKQLNRKNEQMQRGEQNPELICLKPSQEISKQTNEKNHINLSELFYRSPKVQINKKEEIGELRLKLFKPRQNKIEKAISNTRKTLSENKLTNFNSSVDSPHSRKSSLNTTKYNISKWTK